MIKRGTIRLNIERGASVAEFKSFLDDLETAYLAVYALPSNQEWRSLERRFPFLIEFLGAGFFTHRFANTERFGSENVFPLDQIEITRISIQSPGFVELLAAFNPLQQIREYLKDRHERKKDKEWRWESEKDRAAAEVNILRIQAEREGTSAIREFSELLDSIGLREEEKQKILWERVGGPLARLGKHQDSGLLGSQNDNVDSHR